MGSFPTRARMSVSSSVFVQPVVLFAVGIIQSLRGYLISVDAERRSRVDFRTLTLAPVRSVQGKDGTALRVAHVGTMTHPQPAKFYPDKCVSDVAISSYWRNVKWSRGFTPLPTVSSKQWRPDSTVVGGGHNCSPSYRHFGQVEFSSWLLTESKWTAPIRSCFAKLGFHFALTLSFARYPCHFNPTEFVSYFRSIALACTLLQLHVHACRPELASTEVARAN